MQLVAVVLLHNEDVFAERVIRNVAGFCDRVHVADHASTDRTWEIVSGLARELDNVDARRISHAARSHDLVQPYVGTETWVLSPDGDELFDPAGLERMRAELEEGRYDEWFRLIAVDAALRRARRAGDDGDRLSLAARALRPEAVQLRRAQFLGPRLPRAAARGRAGLPRRLELGLGARASASATGGTRARSAACTRASCAGRAATRPWATTSG